MAQRSFQCRRIRHKSGCDHEHVYRILGLQDKAVAFVEASGRAALEHVEPEWPVVPRLAPAARPSTAMTTARSSAIHAAAVGRAGRSENSAGTGLFNRCTKK